MVRVLRDSPLWKGIFGEVSVSPLFGRLGDGVEEDPGLPVEESIGVFLSSGTSRL